MREKIYSVEARGPGYRGQQCPHLPHIERRLDDVAIPVHRNRGEEIHGSNCSDVYWYRVVSGAARCYIVLPGGRRQILDLLMPRRFFWIYRA